ncbi:MAG: putative metal-binding motif-containing protein, partial [Myxococcota bacterium]
MFGLWLGSAAGAATTDADGDGWCAVGVDLSGDGDCDDLGEGAPLGDCDDGQPLASPGLDEIPGDGIDNDCDGGDPPGERAIVGWVVEDVDGDADLADAAAGVGLGVELWRDGGDGAPDGVDDLWLATTATDLGGGYRFDGIGDAPFFVVARPVGWSPAAGIRSGHSADALWAEQTTGPAGSWCADGAGGSATRAEAGPCFGGRDATASDGDGGLGSREHVAAVTLAGADALDVGFSFSFGVVTSDRDGDDAP